MIGEETVLSDPAILDFLGIAMHEVGHAVGLGPMFIGLCCADPALCAQIPDPRQHMVRYYGHYANRARGARGETAIEVTPAVNDTPTERARRRSWARLLKRVFEVDPLLCPQCNVEMKFVAAIQDFSVVDKILAYLRGIGGDSSSWAT